MAYYTASMLVDKSGRPIPQIYDPITDSYKPLTTDVYSRVEVKNVPVKTVKQYYEGSSDTTLNFNESMTGVSVANDGLEHMTITINGVKRTIYAGEVYNADLDPFKSVSITAKDNYRIEVLA